MLLATQMESIMIRTYAMLVVCSTFFRSKKTIESENLHNQSLVLRDGVSERYIYAALTRLRRLSEQKCAPTWLGWRELLKLASTFLRWLAVLCRAQFQSRPTLWWKAHSAFLGNTIWQCSLFRHAADQQAPLYCHSRPRPIDCTEQRCAPAIG